MTQINVKGMKLRQTEILQKNDYSWIMHIVTALLACTVLILTVMELTGFEKIYPPWIAVITGAALCMVYGMFEKQQHQSWFYPGVLILLLVFVLLGRQQILNGICLFWKQIGEVWTANTGQMLPQWNMASSVKESKLCYMLFSILLGGIIGLLCCFLNACMPFLLSLLLSGLLLSGMALMNQDMSFLNIFLVLTSAVFILLYSGWEKKKASFPVLISWGAFLLMLCVFIPITTLPKMEGWAASLSEHIHEAFHEHKYETLYTTLPEGDFTKYKDAGEDKQPALAVTVENPETLYLRGFAGVIFENNRWYALDNKILAENKELLYWLNLNEFNPNAQFQKAVSQMTEIKESSVTVQNIGACSRYLYVPFNLCEGTYLKAENLNTDYITADGGRTYTFTMVRDAAGQVGKVLEYLQESDDEEVLNYRKSESAYREFIYKYYLELPHEVRDMLSKEWDKAASQYGTVDALTVQQAGECALAFLEQAFQDEKKAAKLELPLSVGKGTSYYKATVATMTLRYFGIPARYVEGYIIPEKLAKKAENGTAIEVDSSCAGAWVEVYQDGIGWMPMDLAPGIEELKPKESENPEQKDDNSDVKEAEQLEEMPEDAPQSTGGFLVKIPKLSVELFLRVLLLIFIILLLLIIRRKVLLNRKEKKFHSEDKNDGIAWIFADTALLLEKMGIHRGNGSMLNLCEPVKQQFGEEYAADFTNMVNLNGSAMFSSHELSGEQREAALKFRETTLQHLRTNTKWHKRMWLKWIKCLY